MCRLGKVLDENVLDHRDWNVLLYQKRYRPELRELIKSSCPHLQECGICLKRLSTEDFKREFGEA